MYIPLMKVPFQPTGSWMCLIGNWREATPYFVVVSDQRKYNGNVKRLTTIFIIELTIAVRIICHNLEIIKFSVKLIV